MPLSDFDDVVAFTPPELTATWYSVRSEVETLGSPVSATAGHTAASGVTLDWANPLKAYLAGPRCRHSGPAGRAVTLALSGWPANERAGFVAWDDNDKDYPYADTVTSTGPTDAMSATLTVNAKAPVGLYEIDTYRSDNADSLLDMYDVYQVCTLKPSTSSVAHGHTVRLSGRVPGSGTVVVYATTHKATVAPATLAPRAGTRSPPGSSSPAGSRLVPCSRRAPPGTSSGTTAGASRRSPASQGRRALTFRGAPAGRAAMPPPRRRPAPRRDLPLPEPPSSHRRQHFRRGRLGVGVPGV